MTHAHAKDQGQRSVGSKVRVEAGRRTDGGDCVTSRASAIANDHRIYFAIRLRTSIA